jgi:hypothetical protein
VQSDADCEGTLTSEVGCREREGEEEEGGLKARFSRKRELLVKPHSKIFF